MKGGAGLLNIDKSNELEEIYNRNVDTVFRVCFMFMKSKSDAEDAVQDTFAKLINSSMRFENENHEKAWLIVAASNLCKNNLRHWFRKKRNSFEEYMGALKYEDSHDFEVLDEVLALPDKYKTVIYMYYYEGYSSVEIAKNLHVSESTVRSQLLRGREMLKKSLGGERVAK